jgi:hypothetical protein
MPSPYENLPDRAFWRTGVGNRAPMDPGDLYRPKFAILRTTKIATAGSCFAQHVGRALKESGFSILDAEPAPPGIPARTAEKFGYGIYSARYGNIYTVRSFLQLLREATGQFTPAEPAWEKGGRFFDSQRPSVEPTGLESTDEIAHHRYEHLRAVHHLISSADLFVFTMGLTETWVHKSSGTAYPTAPGTIAGNFDPDRYSFLNLDAFEVFEDFLKARDEIHSVNPSCRFLLTVSPVPLTATASDQHVEVATAYSKAVLRSVCGMLYQRYDDIDYFPSYEIITSANNRGVYFETNKRSVSSVGVKTAMGLFLGAHGISNQPNVAPSTVKTAQEKAEDVQCEDSLLEVFAR